MTVVSMVTCRHESASPCCGGHECRELPVPSFAPGMAPKKAVLGQGTGGVYKV